MRGDAAHRLDIERACLRLRLAAAALATTLALVALPRADAFAAVVIPIALAAAVVLRYLDPGRAPTARIAAGHVVDVVLASGMVYALPVASPAWILYGFVIAIAALRHGPMGAFAGTAASIIAYDLTLFVRAEEAPIDALWNVQALVAVGLIGAELAWATVRSVTERERIRRHATALRAITAGKDLTSVLGMLVTQLIALGLEVWVGDDPDALRRAMGTRRGFVEPLPMESARHIAVAVPEDALDGARLETVARDLVADAGPLITSADRIVRGERLVGATGRSLEALLEMARDESEAAALASLTIAASSIAGRAAIVRLAGGTLVTGEVDADAARDLVRGARMPALITPGGAAWTTPLLARLGARSAAIVAAGEGRALLALSLDRTLASDEVGILQRLAVAAGAIADQLRDRDRLRTEAGRLRAEAERIGGELRAREDAVAMAVHELRNPLTSVRGYASLMSRNLTAVQTQLHNVEQLISDLLGRSPAEGGETSDVVREAREAIARTRTITGRIVELVGPGLPVAAGIEAVRLAQILDNLLRNAAKYSPERSPIVVEIAAADDEVVVAVRDQGSGVEADDLEQIFTPGFRSSRHAEVAGEGLGLAVCRKIVESCGGRIWATSPGRDRGSTFHVALPRVAEVMAL